VPYELRSRPKVQETILPVQTCPFLIVPNFSLSSPPAFSGNPYILQSHENDFIPIQEVEQEEPAELFRLNNWTFPL
jgi:hypothetical protein